MNKEKHNKKIQQILNQRETKGYFVFDIYTLIKLNKKNNIDFPLRVLYKIYIII